MTLNALQLLRRLEPPVRPVGSGDGGAAPPRRPIEQQSFGELLQLVSRGEVRSGLPVTAEFETPVPLDESQLERLAAAADLAESEGARRALMLVDGRALILDVATRTLTGELDVNTPEPLVHLDAAVHVAGPGDDAGPRATGPTTGILSPMIEALRLRGD